MALAGGQRPDSEGLTQQERARLSLANIKIAVRENDDHNPRRIKIANEVLKRAGR